MLRPYAHNTCQSSSITLENDSGLLNTAVNTNGPCTDITGSSFWIWMRDYGCGGMGYLSSGGIKANKAAAILIDGTGNSGNGLIYVTMPTLHKQASRLFQEAMVPACTLATSFWKAISRTTALPPCGSRALVRQWMLFWITYRGTWIVAEVPCPASRMMDCYSTRAVVGRQF